MTNEGYEHTLDEALAVRDSLGAHTAEQVDVGDYPDLLEILYEMNDYGRTATPELAHALNIQVSVLNKFFSQKKPIDIRTARLVADRIVTHFRTNRDNTTLHGDRRSDVLYGKVPELEVLVVKIGEWKLISRTPDLQDKINQLAVLIGEVTHHATTANLPADARALTEIERAQLIAVLETALNLLKSPMIETGLLKKAGRMMKKAAAKAAEKQVELAFGAAASAAGAAIGVLLKHL